MSLQETRKPRTSIRNRAPDAGPVMGLPSVDYRYKLDGIERNHELYAARNDAAAATAASRLLPKAAPKPAAPQLSAPGRSGPPQRDV